MADRFDKFTERTQRALACGQEEAQRFGHTYFGTEHLLLGLVREKDGIAARVLSEFGIQTPKVRAAIEQAVGRGQQEPGGEIGLTPRAKQAIEHSVDEARQRNHHSIDTAHLLLGLLRVEGSMASEVLLALNADIDALRTRVVAILAGHDDVNQRVGRGAAASSRPPASSQLGPPPTEPIDFDRFTERARRVLTLAQEEAQRFNHNYIGTEHLLLGLVRERDGIAARVLASLGVDLSGVRSAVEFIIGRGQTAIMGAIGLTPRTKTVLSLAVDEARRLHHHYIGTEHLLLGLIREGEGIAAGVLESMGVSLERARAEVIKALAPGSAASVTPAHTRAMPTPRPPYTPEEIALLRTPRGDLRQIIPIVQKQVQGDTTLLGVAIERYENAFVANWQITITSVAHHPYPRFDAEAEDDRGNRYRAFNDQGGGGGSSPGGPYEGHFTFRFLPALDPAARSLSITLTLQHAGTSVASEPDPWRFTIAIPPLPEA